MSVTFDQDLYDALCVLWVDEFDSRDFSHVRFLITAPYMMYQIEVFRKFFTELLNATLIVARVGERLSATELAQYHGMYDVALVGDDQFTEKIICDSGVSAICKWGTGIDSIDAEACKKYGVTLTNTPGAFTVPVAQSILAAILGFCRQTYSSAQLMHSGGTWIKLPGKTISEIKIGIIGFGQIGREVARLLHSFNANIGIYDIITFIPNLTVGVKVHETLDSLLEESDIVCTTCTNNPTSRHLLNHETVSLMKPGSYLINMARGQLIEEDALIEALCSGHLAGAALDVFEEEPLPASSPLRKMSNVLLSSHNSNSSPLYWKKVHLNTVRNALKT